MRYFVTGCAGFIGSNLVDRLLTDGHEVIGYDNFVTGVNEFLHEANKSPRFKLIEGDLLNLDLLKQSMRDCHTVFHFAANADVRFGINHTYKDLEQNTLVTHSVLESMRSNKIKKIVFASTGSIYGEANVFPTPEDASFPVQTSLYGASKLAAEGLIQAYCEGFGFQSYIFRFVSILGERYTHGHVFDFYRQLMIDKNHLHILGNGKQKKSYLYIKDCLNAIFTALDKSHHKVNIFNLGSNEYCEVNDSASWICQYLGYSPKFSYSGGDKGWVGDNPFIFLDCKKISSLGWKPTLSIQESVMKTIAFIHDNSWLVEKTR